ncbi:hypothetical protein [Pseudonocardia broussonetiae]|uniref:Copper(I)-binding protein n=1 Tax=Pseudonocardia broussonetiae TaxID=2736640 RepID=A0A6M6JRL4_9PSEU|nr:hypothetical protein [Pseudonocardia broussonetiae]QJY49049.1 hypothetical protein HOP40_27430 [Pseudonocardia broussonetiae]
MTIRTRSTELPALRRCGATLPGYARAMRSIRTTPSHRASVAVVICCTAALTGCGAGQQAATANQLTSSPGSVAAVGSLQVRDAQIAWSGAVPGDEVYAVGEDAPLQLTIVNTTDAGPGGADTLVSLSSPIASSGLIVGDATIPDGNVLTAGYDQPVASTVTEGAREVELTLLDLTTPVRAGMTYPVVLTFADAGELRLQIGVENPSILPPRAGDDA